MRITWLHQLRQRWVGQDGAATIEFALFFPVFMMLLVSSFEVGMANLRNTMLERATDFAVRDVRLGAGTPPTHESLKLDICNNAGIIPDCMNRVQIELNRVDTSTWATLANSAQCIDRSSNIEPVIQFVPGQQNDLMLVRVCVVFDPFFPTFGLN